MSHEEELGDSRTSIWVLDTSEYGIGRGEWQTRTRGKLVMTCSADTFNVEAELDAFEGDTRVFSRNWDPAIPRDGF